MPGQRRRRFLIAGGVLVVFLLLIALPAYLTTRPGFFGRYPGLAAKHKPWLTSTHAEVGCEYCHAGPSFFAQAGYRARMTGEFYVSLVARSRVPDVFAKPGNAACLSCHYDLRTVSPKGDLQIPHKAHVQVLKMKCVECHGYLVHEKSPEGKHLPRMSDCMKCHDGDIADNACTACHTEKAAPDTHRAKDWTSVHATAAALPGAECADCHGFTDKWCADCHSRRPSSHGKDWRKTHGESVAKRRNCESCHAADFCVRCHGEVPQLNFDPTVKVVQ